MADDRDKSARYVLGGKRHDGSKGKKYTKWRENFLDAAEGEGDAARGLRVHKGRQIHVLDKYMYLVVYLKVGRIHVFVAFCI